MRPEYLDTIKLSPTSEKKKKLSTKRQKSFAFAQEQKKTTYVYTWSYLLTYKKSDKLITCICVTAKEHTVETGS